MSYLDSASLVFTGDFRCDVSTVNNDVRHYDIKTFQKRFQLPANNQTNLMNGWWNPDGGALFQFINCKVQHCVGEDGAVDKNHNLVGMAVTNSGDRSGGKMVDLDPQMQMTSELWGVKLTLNNPDGVPYLVADILPTGFRDLQTRQFLPNGNANPAPNGQPLGANFYSVLYNIQWGGGYEKVPLLADLKASADANFDRLSLNLVTFGYYYNRQAARFSLGKIIGSIAAWDKESPLKFAPTRRLYGTSGPFMSFINCGVNEDKKWLAMDLGMAIPLTGPEGTVHANFLKMKLAVTNKGISIDGVTNPIAADQITEIGEIDIADAKTWLAETGGIVSFSWASADTDISSLLAEGQLVILQESQDAAGQTQLTQIAHEAVNGLYLRADQNVHRIDPGQSFDTDFYLYKRGKPLANRQVVVTLDPKVTGAGGGPSNDPDPPTAPIPPNNVPVGKVEVTSPIPTDAHGRTTITLTGTDPGNPRGYIDGQIYLFSYELATVPKAQLNQYFNDKVIIHLRDAFEVPEKPNWKDVRDIWVQFGNLYPIMSHHIMDFSVREEILKQRQILDFAFTRDIHDALYMPVTRDLSQNKMDTLIKWLNTAEAGDESDVALEEEVLMTELRNLDGFTTQPSETLMDIMTLAKAGNADIFEHPLFNQ